MRIFARHKVPHIGDHLARNKRRERSMINGWIGWLQRDTVVCTVERDRRNLNLGTLRELLLNFDEAGLSRRISVPMAVGVNHDIHKIGIIE